MEVTINLDKLNELEITPNQYIYAYLISLGEKQRFKDIMNNQQSEPLVKKDLFKLWQKDYISNEIDNPLLFEFDTIKVNIFTNSKLKNFDGSFETFAESYYALFPKGVKSGNLLVRSGLPTVKKKLEKFLKNNKQYDYFTILKATNYYVEECRANGYQYMKTADYFIFKDNESKLEGYCEQVLNGDITEKYIATDSI